MSRKKKFANEARAIRQNNLILIPLITKIKLGGKGGKGIRRTENGEGDVEDNDEGCGDDDDDDDDEEEDEDEEEEEYDDSDKDDEASSTNVRNNIDTETEENEVGEENENMENGGKREIIKNIENTKCIELKNKNAEKMSCFKMAGYLKCSKLKNNIINDDDDCTVKEKYNKMDSDFNNDTRNNIDDYNMDQGDNNSSNGNLNENQSNPDPGNNHSNGNTGNGDDTDGENKEEKYSKDNSCKHNEEDDGDEDEEEEEDEENKAKSDGKEKYDENDESSCQIKNLKIDTNKENIICRPMDVDVETICIDDDDDDDNEKEKTCEKQVNTKIKNKNSTKPNSSSSTAPFFFPSVKLTEKNVVEQQIRTNSIIPAQIPLFGINDMMKITNTIFKLPDKNIECKTAFKVAASSYAKCTNSRLLDFNKNYLIQNSIDQLCYYINETILPVPGFEDSEDYLIQRAMEEIVAERLKENDNISKTEAGSAASSSSSNSGSISNSVAVDNTTKNINNDNTSVIPVDTETMSPEAKKYHDAKNKILVKQYKNNIYNKYVYVYNVNGKKKNMTNENMINKSDIVKDLNETTADLVDFISTLTGGNNFGQYTTLSENFKLSDISLLDHSPVEKNKNYLFNGDEILMSFKHVNATADYNNNRPSVFHSLFVPKNHLNVHPIFNSMYNVCKEIIKNNMNKNDIVSAYYVEMLFIKHLKTFFKDEEFEKYTKTGSSGNIETDKVLKNIELLLPNKIFESYGKCSFTNLSNMLRMWTSYDIVETVIMKISSIINICLSKTSTHVQPDPKLNSKKEIAESIARGSQAFVKDMHVCGNIIIEPIKHLIQHMWKESQLFTFLLFGISVINNDTNINFSHLSKSVYWIASHNIIEVGKFNNMYKLNIAISLPVMYYFNLFEKCRNDATHFFSTNSNLAETQATVVLSPSTNFYNHQPVQKHISQLYLSVNDCDVVMIATKETVGGNETYTMAGGSNSYDNSNLNKSSDEEFEFKDDERSCYDSSNSSHSSKNRVRKRVIVSKKK